MLWIHPLIQAVCLILATYVMYMGFMRFKFQHLGQKAFFNWKRHVLLGKIVHAIWLLGLALGLFMTQFYWGSINLTEGHYYVGVAMGPMIFISLGTGLMLQKPKGKRLGLALFHGITNVVLYIMALYQAWTAIEVIELFLLD